MNLILVVLDARGQEQTLDLARGLVRAAGKIASLSSSNSTTFRDAAAQDIRILLTGPAPGGLAEAVATGTGREVTVLEVPESASWDAVLSGLEVLVKNAGPDMVLFAHTTLAREAGPALAVALGGVSLSNVIGVERENNDYLFTRPVLDNTRVQQVRVPEGTLCLANLAPGAVVGAEGSPEGFGEDLQDVGTPAGAGRVKRFRQASQTGPSLKRLSLSDRGDTGDGKLTRAPIVVAAGRGIGEKENLERVRAFTACFPKAVTAASRPLVDQGWMPYDRQVGITGAVVSPDLYIALGISGSSQHLAGMAGSKWVVSVNKSPDAPICRHSDLCIQADVQAFIEAFLASRAQGDSGGDGGRETGNKK